MRYYVYISETKVNQLFAQIPVKLRQKIAAKFTIDLKLIKAEFQGREPQESLYSKLEIVLSYLDYEELIGTVDNPNSYFKGVMPLSWGPYESVSVDEPASGGFVYFGGRTEETIIGLGGSLKNVIGEVGPTYSHSHSATPVLIRALRNITRANAFEQGIDVDTAGALQCVRLASGQMGGPWEPMEFVAKRLAYGPVDGTFWVKVKRKHSGYSRDEYEDIGHINAILGSPLYVAMAE